MAEANKNISHINKSITSVTFSVQKHQPLLDYNIFITFVLPEFEMANELKHANLFPDELQTFLTSASTVPPFLCLFAGLLLIFLAFESKQLVRSEPRSGDRKPHPH